MFTIFSATSVSRAAQCARQTCKGALHWSREQVKELAAELISHRLFETSVTHNGSNVVDGHRK